MSPSLQLPIPVLGFRPPLEGFEGAFNTFRLSKAWSKRVVVGQSVLLVDEKAYQAFGVAVVTAIDVGTLAAMCHMRGWENHSQIGKTREAGEEGAWEVIQKLYGPHIALPDKPVTVLTLQRVA